MLKLVKRLVLPSYQRQYHCSKVWSRFSSSGSNCQHSSLGNHHSRKILSSSCSNCVLHSVPITKVLFHTSSSRNALPAILVILMRPLTKFLAIVFGRTIRVWWRQLPLVKRESYRRALIKRRYLYFALLTPVPAGAVYFYISHIEETPITKRKRFIVFSNEQIMQLAEIEQDVIADQHKDAILPAGHPTYDKVLRVISRLLNSNKDIDGINETTWRIIVVDDKSIANAFALPNGTIFIYTGMLDVCTNDNQLSIVMAHEMSHTILRHTAERISNAQMIECLLFIPVVIIWAVLPDLGAVLAQWLSGVMAKMLLHLPFSRQTEMEADDVGLTLAAKACFDVREAPCFWKKMKAVTTDSGNFEWLSTHPSYDTRQIFLDELIPTALSVRDTCLCPKLSSQDPRLSIDSVIKIITQNKILEKQLQSKA